LVYWVRCTCGIMIQINRGRGSISILSHTCELTNESFFKEVFNAYVSGLHHALTLHGGRSL